MNARKILCLMAAVLMLSGCSKGVDGSQASSKAAESSGKADSSVSDYDNTTTEPETDKPEFDLNDSVIGFSRKAAFMTAVSALSLPQTRARRYTTLLTAQTLGLLPREKNTLPLSR